MLILSLRGISMKTIGIIAEFNPFHKGHKYLIDEAKRITNADNVVVVCSGNYVQRGTPAIIDKFSRALMCLSNQVDAVFELPVFYSTSTAEIFARSAVKMLHDFNCIDYLCFGTESLRIDDLKIIADILYNEPTEYTEKLKTYLKEGLSFPKARANALISYIDKENIILTSDISKILDTPNNILAIEYLKALNTFSSSIKPIAIKRKGSGYNDIHLDDSLPSATGIRALMEKDQNFSCYIPKNCNEYIGNHFINIDNYSAILGYKLNFLSKENIYYDVSDDLYNRINNLKSTYTDINTFIKNLQSKNYTYSTISRALLHIILDIRKEHMGLFMNNGYVKFARLIGFNKKSNILSMLKEKSKIKVFSKISDYYKNADNIEKLMLDYSINSDNIYRTVLMNKYKIQLPTEFQQQIVIVD